MLHSICRAVLSPCFTRSLKSGNCHVWTQNKYYQITPKCVAMYYKACFCFYHLILYLFAMKMAVVTDFFWIRKWVKSEDFLSSMTFGPTIPCTFPYKLHKTPLSSSSYNTILILALQGGCNGWQVCGPHLTHLSFCLLGFHCPSYQACPKTTQFCLEGCCLHPVWHPAQIDEEWCVRGRCSQGQETWCEIWLVVSLERVWFGQLSPMCMSYALLCNLPLSETSTFSGQWDVFWACYLTWNLTVWWVGLDKWRDIDVIL